MKTLIIRTLSGTVYVVLIVSAILLNNFYFAAVFGLLAALTTCEFHKLTNRLEYVSVTPVFPAIASFSLFIICSMLHFSSGCKSSIYLSPSHIAVPIIFAVIYFAFYIFAFILAIFRKKSNPVHNVAYAFFGQIYIAVPFVVMFCIKSGIGKIFLLALFVIIWVNDTFAYLTGSWLGKHKMYERISQKKSWEGFFGGLVGALIAGFVFSKFDANLNLIQCLVFSVIIAVSGTLGDLFESLIKRTAGVKDSGNIMPGHGGFLDRLDSVIFAALPAFIFLELCL
ncbi:MAG: phosphatidate cytidylyltransferase [Prevotellaceae bacterium]|jgi:phosphatidate cytidylyltransferase|nr:phosphatidate cytidylyltransferase [Prevotellaceae bacterium]